MLGAKWFDSEERYRFVDAVVQDHGEAITKLDQGKERWLTAMETTWVSVAFENGVDAEGGAWVVEFEMNVYGHTGKDNPVPENAGRIGLARSMEEKCAILKNMGAKFYKGLGDYKGKACLNMWETKVKGNLAPLLEYCSRKKEEG